MTTAQTALAKKMLEAAEREACAATAENLRAVATRFTEAAVGFYAVPQAVDVRTFFRAWAAARLCWHRYSGEPLL